MADERPTPAPGGDEPKRRPRRASPERPAPSEDPFLASLDPEERAAELAEAARLRNRCIVRRPTLVVEVSATLVGIEPTHLRRIALPAAWSLRAAAEIVGMAFGRTIEAVAVFEIRRANGAVQRHVAGTAGSRAASQGTASLNDVLTPDIRQVTLIDGAAPTDFDQRPKRERTIDPAWVDADWFHRTAWRTDLHVDALRMEAGEEAIPRILEGRGANAGGHTPASFQAFMARWRSGEPPADAGERLDRERLIAPDLFDRGYAEWLMHEFAAPVWRRAKRLDA